MPTTAALTTIIMCFTSDDHFKRSLELYGEILPVKTEPETTPDGSRYASFYAGPSREIELRLVQFPLSAPIITSGGIVNGQTLLYWATDPVDKELPAKYGYRYEVQVESSRQSTEQYLTTDGAGSFFFFGGHPNPSFPPFLPG